MAAAVSQCDRVVASVFVNPTQFGVGEDLDSYPRDFEHDCRLLEEKGCSMVFHPEVEEMYLSLIHILDPPNHLFADRTTLDAFPVSQFVGRALVIDCRDLKEGETITIDRITKYGSKAVEADYLLFNLGWDARWGTEDYYKDYPCIDDDVVNFILTTDKKGVGLDVIGIDPIPDEDLPIHKKLFREHEIVNIENLKDLDKCGDDLFWFFALPLKWENADGAPIRAIAFWE